MRARRAVLLAWLVGAAVACQSEVVPATQVIVEISSELELDTELRSIVVRLGAADGSGEASEEREFRVGVDPARTDLAPLPMRFAVLPGRAEKFRISVIGYGPTGADGRLEPVIEQRAITTFRPRETILVQLVLAKICHRVLCGETAEQVCYPAGVGSTRAGSCGPVPTDPGVVIDPRGADWPDAGSTAPRDAGQDATPEQAADAAGPDATAALDADAARDDSSDGRSDGADDATLPDASGDAMAESGMPELDASLGDGSTDAQPPGPDAAFPVDAAACMRWVDSGRSLPIPTGAVPGGFEYSYARYPEQRHVSNHYVCRIEHQGNRYPGKLAENARTGTESLGCYAYVDRQLAPERFSVLTLASGCVAAWAESGQKLPQQAVIAGQETDAGLVPCMAPVTDAAFPLRAGDPYSDHTQDTHLGYVPAQGAYRCVYEFLEKGYEAPVSAGFKVLVWTSSQPTP